MIRLMIAAALMLGPSFAEKTGTARPKLATPPAMEGCDAEDLQKLVGQSFADATADQAREASGAGVVRVVRPGQAVTMDIRGDRLTITLDEAGKIVTVRCG